MRIELFVEERNEALFSLDEKKIRAYASKHGIAMPSNNKVFWAGVYKAILAIQNSPEELRARAKKWLQENGFREEIA